MEPGQYHLHTGQAFAFPIDPGPYDTTIGTQVGANTRAKKEALHQEKYHAHRIYTAICAVIKKQLKQAIPDDTIRELEDDIEGLNGVSTINILTHCFDRVGHINDTLIDDNRIRVNEPFDVNEGMVAYIRIVEQYQLIANDANEPWTDAQLVRIGQTAIGRTGVFKLEYKAWLKKPIVDRKWTDFTKYWME